MAEALGALPVPSSPAAKRAGRIAALHLPRFLIQRRLREDGSLAHRPVAVVRPERGVPLVVAASRRALIAGVCLGSTATQAKATCPGLRVLPDDPVADLRALEGLAEALLVATPAVELCGPSGLFCDASAAPLFKGEAGLVEVLLDRARALGYRGQLVIADNKFAAMALAVHRPRPSRVTGPTRAALAPLPLAALPLPEALRWSFQAMGLSTLGELAALPASGVAARFGEEGSLAQRLALGDDPRPLCPFRPAPPLIEALWLEWPSDALEPVLFGLKTVLDRLTARLSGRGLALTRLEVSLKLEPPHQGTACGAASGRPIRLEPPHQGTAGGAASGRPIRLEPPHQGTACGAASGRPIRLEPPHGEERVVLPLARPTSSARLLLDIFRERLRDFAVTAPVKGVLVEALETGPAERIQLCVGERPEVDEALEAVLARLQGGLGEAALGSARPLSRHRPEDAWERAPFRPADAPAARGPGTGCDGEEAKKPARAKKAFIARLLHREGERAPLGRVPLAGDPLLRPGARPTRLLQRPQPLQVELSASGRLVAVRIGQKRCAAAAVRGPERLCGEWWKAGFARDYYRALVVGLGGCWIFRDERDGRFYLHGYFD